MTGLTEKNHDAMQPEWSTGRTGWLGTAARIGKGLLVAAVIALAAFLLYRTLADYSFDELVASVAAVPMWRLATAGAFAAASYACLTFFDYLALHHVGRPLAYPKAALASFTSLSIGHNIGFAALSSGAVRYRFYSRWGMTAPQVATVIVFCGATVGLGLMILGGLALILQVDLAVSFSGLPRSAIIALGALCLALAGAYVALSFIVSGALGIGRWKLEMPKPPIAMAQVVVGPLNFACVAACLHETLNAVADVGYLQVAAAYVIANTTVLISHVPGGLGVIEAVVVHLLPEADLIGALLVFRFVYFLVPLTLGGAVFLVSEAVLRSKSTDHGSRR